MKQKEKRAKPEEKNEKKKCLTYRNRTSDLLMSNINLLQSAALPIELR